MIDENPGSKTQSKPERQVLTSLSFYSAALRHLNADNGAGPAQLCVNPAGACATGSFYSRRSFPSERRRALSGPARLGWGGGGGIDTGCGHPTGTLTVPIVPG